MKTSLQLIAFVFLFASCSKKYIEVLDINSNNISIKNEYYVYETDTLKITYTFWSEKGIMSFAVYNKLDLPIFIDWKNSSFIYNDNKFNYWIDLTETKVNSYYSGYYYKGPLIRAGFSGEQTSMSSTSKPERITFIPPKSNYYRSQFYLMPTGSYNLSSISQIKVVPRNDQPKKNTKIYFENFTSSNSPMRFRNYLAVSLSENSSNYIYIDNEFYLSSIKKMIFSHYNGKIIDTKKNGFYIYEKPFVKPTSFYLIK